MGGSTGGTSKQSPMLGGAPTTNPAQARVGALRNKIPAKQPFGSPMAATQPAMQSVPQTGQPAGAPTTPTPAPTVQPPQPTTPNEQARQADPTIGMPYNQALAQKGLLKGAMEQHSRWQQQAQEFGVPMHQLQAELERRKQMGDDFSVAQGMPGGMQGVVASRFGQEQAAQSQLRGQLERQMLGDPQSQARVDMALGNDPGSAFSSAGQAKLQQGWADPTSTMQQIERYNQFRQQGRQNVDQNYSPEYDQRFREAQDQGYQQLMNQNQKIDQSTYEGFRAANALRAARPQTNSKGYNDIARARSRAEEFSRWTPEQWAERQRNLATYDRSK